MVTADTINVSIILLSISVVLGIVASAHHARSLGTYINVRSLLLLIYVLVEPVSGIVHLLRLGSVRGYFDLLRYDDTALLLASGAAGLGLVFLVIGCGWSAKDRSMPGVPGPTYTKTDLNIALVASVLILPPSIYALVQVTSYAQSASLARIISLEGGLARYAYLSHWIVWGISLLAILICQKLGRANVLATAMVLLLSVALIVASLSWTGGRSVALVLSLPLVFVLLPTFGRLRSPLMYVGLAGFAAYAVVVSNIRADSYYSGVDPELGNWLDWEWGRFSMVGVALEYVRLHGLLFGETFLQGLAAAFIPPLSLVGISVPPPSLVSSTEMASRILFGTFGYIHVVPGFSAELYANFGLPGIAAGYFILGRAGRWLDHQLGRTSGFIQKLALYYFGVVLVLRVVTADSGAIWTYLFYSGAPLLLCAGVSRVMQRRQPTPVELNREANETT